MKMACRSGHSGRPHGHRSRGQQREPCFIGIGRRSRRAYSRARCATGSRSVGQTKPITVVRKESGWSPDFFRRRIMGDKDFVAEAVIVDSKEEVVAEVVDRPWSIGVTGMPEAIPALDRLSLLRLVSESSDEDSTYALSRPLFFFTVEGSPSVGHFLEFRRLGRGSTFDRGNRFLPGGTERCHGVGVPII